ncbi:MAG: phosphoribosylamine--glycine ligase family protein [Aquabacterium sp.]
MNVLVVGKGGREHALVWKLRQSPRAGQGVLRPGNAGTARDGTNVPFDGTDFDRMARFCKKENIGLVVIGPEDPLALGLSDYLRGRGIVVFGPSKDAARIEVEQGLQQGADAARRRADRRFPHLRPPRRTPAPTWRAATTRWW